MDNSIKRTNVAINLRNIRKKHNMTQEAVADKLGIKRNTYARYETDTVPPLSVLTKLCELFAITTDEILRPSTDYMSRVQNRPQSAFTFSTYKEYPIRTIDNAEMLEKMKEKSSDRHLADARFIDMTDDEVTMVKWYRSLSDEQKDAVKKLFNLD